jgi:hypothetical protein
VFEADASFASKPGPSSGLADFSSRATLEGNFSGPLGRFGRALLEQAGVLPLLEEVRRGSELTAEGFGALVDLDFPLLAKFLEASGKVGREIRVRPVVFAPVAERIERLGVEQAAIETVIQLKDLDSSIVWDGPISIAIDRWHGRFEFEDLVQTLKRTGELLAGERRTTGSNLNNTFRPLGPSAADIKASGTTVEQFLNRLKTLTIDTIEGGDDSAIHVAAGKLGFNSVIGQDIGIIRPSLSSTTIGAATQFKSRADFFAELYSHFQSVKAIVANGGRVDTWFPRLPEGFDNGPSALGPSTGEQTSEGASTRTDRAILGLDLCRVFMLARLALSDVAHVRAPLAKVGPRLAAVALSFGANDLGFAAFDPVTAKTLGVLEISKISDIVPAERIFLRVL